MLEVLKTILLVNLGKSFAIWAGKKLFIALGRWLAKKTETTLDDEIVAELEKRLS